MAISYEKAYQAALNEFQRRDKEEGPGALKKFYEPSDFYSRYMGISPSDLKIMQEAALNAFYDHYLKEHDRITLKPTEIQSLATRCIRVLDARTVDEKNKEKLLEILGITCDQYEQAKRTTQRRILIEQVAIVVMVVIGILVGLHYANNAISKENSRFFEAEEPLKNAYIRAKEECETIVSDGKKSCLDPAFNLNKQLSKLREKCNQKWSCINDLNRETATHNETVSKIKNARNLFFQFSPAVGLGFLAIHDKLTKSSVAVETCTEANETIRKRLKKSS